MMAPTAHCATHPESTAVSVSCQSIGEIPLAPGTTQQRQPGTRTARLTHAIDRLATFTGAYIKSMRLYYSFVTGIAGWLGVAYYDYLATASPEHTIEIAPSLARKVLILAMLFLSWGINQIINDFLGLAEDRINAPQRPMVTGELNPHWALTLSVLLMVGCGVITWVWLEPFAVLFLVAGVLLNVVYEYAKGHGLWGNLVFGLMITMAPLYGGYASGPTASTALLPHRASILSMIFVLNALMTFYTYFKDYRGDRLAGKNTVVVILGLRRSRTLALALAGLPATSFLLLRLSGLHTSPLNATFLMLGALTVVMQIVTGVLYFRHPSGVAAYRALEMNFRACTCGQATLVALFNPELALWLFLFSYILVGLLFRLHSNPEA